MHYYATTKKLHLYDKFDVSGKMSSIPNTKKLQYVTEADNPRYKLFLFNYYKTRAGYYYFFIFIDCTFILRILYCVFFFYLFIYGTYFSSPVLFFSSANLMFGFNTYIMKYLRSFNEFNSLRKNQLLAFYDRVLTFFALKFSPSHNIQ